MQRLLRAALLALCAVLQSAWILAAEVTPIDRVTNRVKVMDGPSTSDTRQVGELRPGQRAELLDDVANWYQVKLTSGQEGFVSKRWVRIIVADAAGGGQFELHMIDVGNGDALILDMGDNEILIDGGMFKGPLTDYVAAQPDRIIQEPIELAIVTHADSDHWKGMSAFLRMDNGSPTPSVLEFWEPGYDRDCGQLASYDHFIAAMRNHVPDAAFKRPLSSSHIPASDSGTPQPFTLPAFPGVTFTLLHVEADPDGPNCAFRINNASIVLKLEIAGVTLLLTGDANGKTREQLASVTPGHVEARLLAIEQQHPGTLKADVLKVAHHGSETANTDEFIAAVKPRFAIISASTGHHLPDPTVVRRYEDSGAIVLRTDRSRQRGDDHIVCIGSGGEIDCQFADEM